MVVDNCKTKMSVFDTTNGTSKLVIIPVSREQNEQRMGRAGRTRPGCAVRNCNDEQVYTYSPALNNNLCSIYVFFSDRLKDAVIEGCDGEKALAYVTGYLNAHLRRYWENVILYTGSFVNQSRFALNTLNFFRCGCPRETAEGTFFVLNQYRGQPVSYDCVK